MKEKILLEIAEINGNIINKLISNEFPGIGEKVININTGNLASGAYFVKLSNAKSVLARKFIISH